MRTMSFLWIFLLFTTASAEVTEATLREALASYNDHSEQPLPILDAAELTTLLAGETVTLSDRVRVAEQEDDRIRVVGLHLYRRPRDIVWVASLYKEFRKDGPLIEHFMPGEGGDYQLYQHLSLPWPLKDRHWSIDISKAKDLAAATDDTIWEHRWQLTPDGEAQLRQVVVSGDIPGLNAKRFDKAVYLPINQGGWTAFQVGDDATLIATHLSTVLSGWIPDRWVARYTRRGMKRLMARIDEFAANINELYVPEEFLVYTGTGEPIDLDQLQPLTTSPHPSPGDARHGAPP